MDDFDCCVANPHENVSFAHDGRRVLSGIARSGTARPVVAPGFVSATGAIQKILATVTVDRSGWRRNRVNPAARRLRDRNERHRGIPAFCPNSVIAQKLPRGP
jgi:hypothetical protein